MTLDSKINCDCDCGRVFKDTAISAGCKLQFYITFIMFEKITV